MKRTITLEIAGGRYRVTSDAEEDRLQRLADIVNERVATLGHKARRTASSNQLLAVVALSLADDWLSAEKDKDHLREITKTSVERALARIDRALAADTEAQTASPTSARAAPQG